jgi:hypothetical protein
MFILFIKDFPEIRAPLSPLKHDSSFQQMRQFGSGKVRVPNHHNPTAAS